jgi:hypothetical protein
MTHTALRTSEDIISAILNLVCPECGGAMGGLTKEFKCRGKCRRDWRRVWKNSLLAELVPFTRTVHLTTVSACRRKGPGGNLSPAVGRRSRRHLRRSRRGSVGRAVASAVSISF